MNRRGMLAVLAGAATAIAAKTGWEPEHVKIARKLGWKNCRFTPYGNLSGFGGTDLPVWIGDPPDDIMVNCTIPRYDLDDPAEIDAENARINERSWALRG